jgi:hypothetical protein
MIAQEMQREFGIQINQLDSALTLTSTDIFYWLNKAQEKFVKDRFNGVSVGLGFEQSYQLIADLQQLVERSKQIIPTYINESVLEGISIEKSDLPTNYLYLIAHRSAIWINYPEVTFDISVNEVDSTERRIATGNARLRVVRNRLSQSDDIYKLLEDPFNTTTTSSPLTTISGNSIFTYSNKSFLVKETTIDYIRYPKTISLTADPANYETDVCELPVHLHKEIIQLGVDLFLQNTRELKQRLQGETPNQTQNTEEQ